MSPWAPRVGGDERRASCRSGSLVALALAVMVAVTAACGGGGGADPSPPAPTGDRVLQTTEAMDATWTLREVARGGERCLEVSSPGVGESATDAAVMRATVCPVTPVLAPRSWDPPAAAEFPGSGPQSLVVLFGRVGADVAAVSIRGDVQDLPIVGGSWLYVRPAGVDPRTAVDFVGGDGLRVGRHRLTLVPVAAEAG